MSLSTALAQDPDDEFRDPMAQFTVSPGRPEPGESATASALPVSKAYSPCTPIVSYEWDWDGDGEFEVNNTGSGAFISTHVFEEEGVHQVSLRVTDSCGQTATATKSVTVGADDPPTFDFSVVFDRKTSFARATWLVLYLSVTAILLGLPLGVFWGLLRISPFAPLRWIAGAYIEFIRGTPLLVQIFIVWLGLPQIHSSLKFSAVTAGLIALVINTSAYQAEIIRAGIQAIPRGQTEAAYGMGFSKTQTMRHIILPQALRLVIPPLTNEFIILIKDTSLLFAIGVIELMATARIIGSLTFRIFEPLAAVALIYFVMTYSLSLLLQHMERRLAIPGLGVERAKGAH